MKGQLRRLKKRLRIAGIGQVEMAVAMRTDPGRIANLLNGRITCTAETANRLEAAAERLLRERIATLNKLVA